jgi:hypothetical protein
LATIWGPLEATRNRCRPVDLFNHERLHFFCLNQRKKKSPFTLLVNFFAIYNHVKTPAWSCMDHTTFSI